MKFDNKVAVVTGAAQGIGEACARRFAANGAHVLLADIDDARGAALAADLGARYLHCDVGDKAQVDAAVAQALAAHGRIDVLVNNAGIFKASDFLAKWTKALPANDPLQLPAGLLLGEALDLERGLAQPFAPHARGIDVVRIEDRLVPRERGRGLRRAPGRLPRTGARRWRARCPSPRRRNRRR